MISTGPYAQYCVMRRAAERVTVIPNHACAVTNLHDVVYGVRGDRVERVLQVAARGKVQ